MTRYTVTICKDAICKQQIKTSTLPLD